MVAFPVDTFPKLLFPVTVSVPFEVKLEVAVMFPIVALEEKMFEKNPEREERVVATRPVVVVVAVMVRLATFAELAFKFAVFTVPKRVLLVDDEKKELREKLDETEFTVDVTVSPTREMLLEVDTELVATQYKLPCPSVLRTFPAFPA